MKAFTLLTIAVLLSCSPDCVAAQENQGDTAIQNHQNVTSSVGQLLSRLSQRFEDHLDRLQSHVLPFWSQRELMQRCGNYWVSTYSKLIAPNDREIGFWGIETPLHSNLRR